MSLGQEDSLHRTQATPKGKCHQVEMKNFCSSKNLTEGRKRQAMGYKSVPHNKDGLISTSITSPVSGKEKADEDITGHC